jgi:ferrochelatase
MRFRPEPSFRHDTAERIGVLLVNIGTPASPTAGAVRRYLGRFLADPRVVELPRWLWLPLLHGVILTVRSGKSAAKYASIWQDGGSPLAVHTRAQAEALQARFAREHGDRVMVAHAMRYSDPDVSTVLARLQAAGCTRIVIVPMYPQYASATTGSTLDAVFDHLKTVRHVPALRIIKHHHDDAGFIAALAARVRSHWAAHGRPEVLLMSFHGLPRRSLDQGDPYHCECLKTARLLAEALELPREAWTVSFQSRFGANRWLEPYTIDVVRQLAARGVRHLQVVAPSFVADCLETLEEIGVEIRDAFLAAGGSTFSAIACLNDDPAWIEALGALVERELTDWLPLADEHARQRRAARAREAGAAD